MIKSIQILYVTFLRGPNLWTYYPVIEAWVDLGLLEEYPSNKLQGFNEQLLDYLPGLNEHQCGLEIPGGFIERLKDGTWLGHILEHVALELQGLAGMPTRFGKTRQTDQYGIYKLVFRSDHEKVGRAVLYVARDLLMAIIEKQYFDLNSALSKLRTLVKAVQMSPVSALLVSACDERRIPSIRIGDTPLVQLGYGKNQQRIWESETEKNSSIADEIAQDKPLAKSLLRACGIAMQESIIVTEESEAWEAAQDIGTQITLRPAGTNNYALAALTPLDTKNEVLSEFQQLRQQNHTEIIAEQFIPGNTYQVIMLEQEIIAVTFEEKSDQRVFFDQEDIKKIHPSILSILTRATRVIGLAMAGISLVVEDLTRSAKLQSYVILDICSNPDLMYHINPGSTQSKLIARRIIQSLFPGDQSPRIPIIGITGSKGTTLIARLLSWLVHLTGKKVGMACRDGLYFNQSQLSSEQSIHFKSGERLLINRFVETVILEHDTNSILTEGFAYDRCTVGIVTDCSNPNWLNDFYIRTPDDLSPVLCTQVQVILPTGTAVLNAADKQVVKMADHCDGSVIFYAQSEDLEIIQQHLNNQNRCVFVRDHKIILAHHQQQITLLPLSQLCPDLLPEIDAVLASVASAWALDIESDVIVTGLNTYNIDSIVDVL